MGYRSTAALLILLTLAAACVAPSGNAQTRSLTQTPPPPTPTPPPYQTTAVPEAPAYGACGYVWATRPLPELSLQLDAELKILDAGAAGSAYAFGEDCVFADGTRTFSAMETDFRVSIPVQDLKAEETLGTWIASVMKVIETLPQGGIQGPRPGRVEFEFRQGATDSLRMTVDIARYRNEARGSTGARLFQLFSTPK